jgi:hypothetical protein
MEEGKATPQKGRITHFLGSFTEGYGTLGDRDHRRVYHGDGCDEYDAAEDGTDVSGRLMEIQRCEE